jgi:hypothetical protein
MIGKLDREKVFRSDTESSINDDAWTLSDIEQSLWPRTAPVLQLPMVSSRLGMQDVNSRIVGPTSFRVSDGI